MFRVDYAATVYLGHPLAKMRRRGDRIPFLMYHSLSDQPLGLHPYYETTTSPAVFRRQMAQLHSSGLQGVSVSEAMRRVRSNELAPCVAITFDDGYRDVYTEALPVLLEFKFSASVYVIADRCKLERSQFKGRDCLTVRELQELASHGIEIGSHTVSHPQLHDLTWTDIESEVGDAKHQIESVLGSAIESFCYPYAFPEPDGAFVQRFRSLLQEKNYRNSVTTLIGTVERDSDQFMLPRLPVNTFDDERLFQAKLDGGYDWLRTPQYALKSLKHMFSHRN
jgi:peptidoglycan/xylan/chitin deacetylase (PgdA/CDA1 family)